MKITEIAINRKLMGGGNGGGGGSAPVIMPLEIAENGTYTAPDFADGYSPITVEVDTVNNQELAVTENGEYVPDAEHTGFSKVMVDVDTVNNQALSVTENGTYLPDDEHTGFSEVTVSVEIQKDPIGKEWIASDTMTSYANRIAYGNGVWCLSTYYPTSGIYYSLDGKTWHATAVTGIDIYDICFQGRFWFATCNKGTLYSRTGRDWSLSQYLPDYPDIFWLTAAEGIVMGLDRANKKVYKWDISWDTGTQINYPLANSLYAGAEISRISHSNGFWFIGLNGGIMTSADKGRTWTLGGTQWGNAVTFYDFAAYNEVLVGTASGAMVYSTDYGANWFAAQSFSNPSIAYFQYGRVLAGDGIFVAEGNPEANIYDVDGIGLIYSTDGFNWHECTVDGSPIKDHLTGLAYLNHRWYAASEFDYDNSNHSPNLAYSYYSDDGIHWKKGGVVGYPNTVFATDNRIVVACSAKGAFYSERSEVIPS